MNKKHNVGKVSWSREIRPCFEDAISSNDFLAAVHEAIQTLVVVVQLTMGSALEDVILQTLMHKRITSYW